MSDKYSLFIVKESPVFYLITRYIASFTNIRNYNAGGIISKKIEVNNESNESNENNESNESNKSNENNNKTSETKTNLVEVIKDETDKETKNENVEDDKNFTIDHTLILKAPYGSYTLDFKDNKIDVDYYVSETIVGTDKIATKYENIKLQANTKELLLDFVEEARSYCETPMPKQSQKYITIKQYDIQYNKWTQLSQLKKRNLSSVFLDKDIIDNLKNDIEKFLKLEDTYKRNYLLYGIPGTGKTSLIFALASYLNMSVSIFSFVPGIDDTIFMKCVNSLPKNSILLLEDIDGVFVNRAKDYNNNSMISFSGVLNTLDGMGRKDKLLTFMTTNLKDQLDPALLRPGRVDYKIEFTYTTNYQISKMYDLFIKDDTHKKEFMSYVKTKKITTCILQKFLFEFREEPNIMDKIDIFDMYVDSYHIAGKNLYT